MKRPAPKTCFVLSLALRPTNKSPFSTNGWSACGKQVRSSKRFVFSRFAFSAACSRRQPQHFDGSVATLVSDARNSAAKLVNLLADHFACFRDEAKFEGKTVRLLKRAQIFVADLWAAFGGEGYGEFHDIDKITMFAGVYSQGISGGLCANAALDYRVPQMLHTLGCISYSPPLEVRIRHHEEIEPGHSWEIQLRGQRRRTGACVRCTKREV